MARYAAALCIGTLAAVSVACNSGEPASERVVMTTSLGAIEIELYIDT